MGSATSGFLLAFLLSPSMLAFISVETRGRIRIFLTVLVFAPVLSSRVDGLALAKTEQVLIQNSRCLLVLMHAFLSSSDCGPSSSSSSANPGRISAMMRLVRSSFLSWRSQTFSACCTNTVSSRCPRAALASPVGWFALGLQIFVL